MGLIFSSASLTSIIGFADQFIWERDTCFIKPFFESQQAQGDGYNRIRPQVRCITDEAQA